MPGKRGESARLTAGETMRAPRRAATRPSGAVSSGLSSSSTCATATGPRTTAHSPGSAAWGDPSWKPARAAAASAATSTPPGPTAAATGRPGASISAAAKLRSSKASAPRDERIATPRRARPPFHGEPVARGAGELGGHRGRVEREHGGIPAVVRPSLGRLGQRPRVARLAVELGVRGRGRRRAVQPGLAQVRGRRCAHAAAAQHHQLHGLLLDVRDAVLADRQPPFPPRGRLPLAVEPRERAAGQVG